MKYYILSILFTIFTATASNAQFQSVSTNMCGWAAGNINIAVDVNVNLRNTINIPISVSPFKFGEAQWRHVALQPGWRHWLTERYIGHFISPSLIYANYEVGFDKHLYKGNAYGMGFSWGYAILLNTRWSFVMEFGVGLVYTPYTKQQYSRYIGEFDDEWLYKHQRLMFIPAKCNLSFSYLF